MKLFTVGPVEMHPETLGEAGRQLPYFRTPEFSEIMLQTEQMLLQLAGAPEHSRAVFLTASGTGAMEAAVINLLDQRGRVLTIDGGSFGHRFVQICQSHAIPQTVIPLAFGEELTEQMLEDVYTGDLTALLVNLHETSTGMLYDIEMLHDFCQQHNLLLIVDAISSFLADPIDMKQDGIDVLIVSSQKSLALAPGISAVVLSPRAVDMVQKHGTNVVYFDFRDYLKNGERGQTPFTPAIGILLTMHSRLSKIMEEGLERIQASTQNLALDFRAKIKGLPIEIPNYPHSNALTPVYFPGGNAKSLYNELRQKYGLNVTPNGGALENYLLRVGHIGNLTVEDNDCLVQAMREVLGSTFDGNKREK